ncbi:MAG: polyprenyl synthetase family protein, partial [Candidatus Zixiibacteriota bacterium]
QIIDDILDIEGDQELLGKNVGADRKRQKATYPKVVGLKQARQDASQLIEDAINLFDEFDDNILKDLAHYISRRQN